MNTDWSSGKPKEDISSNKSSDKNCNAETIKSSNKSKTIDKNSNTQTIKSTSQQPNKQQTFKSFSNNRSSHDTIKLLISYFNRIMFTNTIPIPEVITDIIIDFYDFVDTTNMLFMSTVFVGCSQTGKTSLINTLINEYFTHIKYSNTNNINYDQTIQSNVIGDIILDTQNTPPKVFPTDKKIHLSLIDTPGNIKYITNMINGMVMSDMGIILLSSQMDDNPTSYGRVYEQYFQDYPWETTRVICSCLHLQASFDRIIVCITYNDTIDETRFKNIKNTSEKLLTKIGYKTKKIPFIPVNLNNINDYDTLKWYKGWNIKIKREKITGFTLQQAMFILPQKYKLKLLLKREFIMPISKVFYTKYNNGMYIVAGKIEHATVKLNDEVKFILYSNKNKNKENNLTYKVISIQRNYESLDSASHSDVIGIGLSPNFFKDNQPEIGDALCMNKQINNNWDAYEPVMKFGVLVFIQGCNYNEKITLRKGKYNGLMCVRSGKCIGKLTDIKWKMGRSTNKQKVENAESLELGDQAEVIITVEKPMVITTFDQCKALGRLAIIDQNTLVALGKVIKTFK